MTCHGEWADWFAWALAGVMIAFAVYQHGKRMGARELGRALGLDPDAKQATGEE